MKRMCVFLSDSIPRNTQLLLHREISPAGGCRMFFDLLKTSPVGRRDPVTLCAVWQTAIIPATFSLTTGAVRLLSVAVIAVIVVQPDRRPVRPGAVDLRVEREVLLPAPHARAVRRALAHARIKQAHRRTLLKQPRVDRPPAGVAVKDPPRLLV